MIHSASSPGYRGIQAIVLIVGCLLPLYGAGRRLDHRSLSLWHEADYTEIARNFAREDMDIRYPRIDWRRDSSGKVEMELPLVPWLAAVSTRLLGTDERVMRLLAAALSIATFLLFRDLAGRALTPLAPAAALFATAAYALSPLAVYLSTRMQPEPCMMFFLLLAGRAIWRWYDEPSTGRLLAAAAFLAAAILLKEPAASLGLLFAWLICRRRRLSALRDGRVYLAAAIALVPPIAWYAWAYRFWIVDGNSLGLSDEAHRLGLDILVRRGILGNAWVEAMDVFTPLGLVLGFLGLRYAWRRIEPAAIWYASALVFYLVAARTAGAGWAFYYHCLSIAPACLLMGAGAGVLQERWAVRRPGGAAGRRRALPLRAALPALVLASLAAMTAYRLAQRDGLLDAASTGVRTTQRRMSCAAELARRIPAAGRIAVRGLNGADGKGHAIAYSDPTFFAFADRKGFVYEERNASVATLEALARRGARYWIVAEGDLDRPPFDRATLDRTFSRLATCADGYALYDLATPRPVGGSGSPLAR